MAALRNAQDILKKLKQAYSRRDYSGAAKAVSQIKLLLIEFPSLPPAYQSSPTAEQELLLAREALEYAVFISVHLQDSDGFDRNFSQLKDFYTDARGLLPAPQNEYPIVGLNLLHLLVGNRIAEFHTELEVIPPEVQQNPYVKNAIQLEQWLMEGAYHKVLEAPRQLKTDELHSKLITSLADTVRDEIVSCCEKAYPQLSLKDAQKLMMFKSEKELLSYASKHEWTVEKGYIVFKPNETTLHKDLPSMTLINEALVYAKELERIV